MIRLPDYDVITEQVEQETEQERQARLEELASKFTYTYSREVSALWELTRWTHDECKAALYKAVIDGERRGVDAISVVDSEGTVLMEVKVLSWRDTETPWMGW